MTPATRRSWNIGLVVRSRARPEEVDGVLVINVCMNVVGHVENDRADARARLTDLHAILVGQIARGADAQ